MKIKKAHEIYSAQLNTLWNKKQELLKKQKDLKGDKEKKQQYDSVTIELKEVSKQYDTVSSYMDKITEMQTAVENAEAAMQQGNAMAEAAVDLSKCLEVARRIASGAKVPQKDIQKLIETYPQLYINAVNAAAMNHRKSDEEYESLWKDEENGSQLGTADTIDSGEIEINCELPDTVPVKE